MCGTSWNAKTQKPPWGSAIKSKREAINAQWPRQVLTCFQPPCRAIMIKGASKKMWLTSQKIFIKSKSKTFIRSIQFSCNSNYIVILINFHDDRAYIYKFLAWLAFSLLKPRSCNTFFCFCRRRFPHLPKILIASLAISSF